MLNMSYCRINAIKEGETSELSSFEVRALEEFLDLVREITNLEYEIQEITANYGD